jgi:hypothetical protein
MIKIEISTGLRSQVTAALENLERQASSSAKDRSEIETKIKSLEADTASVARAIEELKLQAHASDGAAGQLIISERREMSLSIEIERLKIARNAAHGVDLIPAILALDAVVNFYRQAVKDELLKAIAPFEMPEQLALPLFAHCGAMRTLAIIRDWTTMLPSAPADMRAVLRLQAYLRRALAGNLCLHRDTPRPAESAPVLEALPEVVESTGEVPVIST